MMKSMTAYARMERSAAARTALIEIRAVNSRYLDLVQRLPQQLLPLEERIKSLVGRHVIRGRIELRLQIQQETAPEETYEVDRPRAMAYRTALEELKRVLGLEEPVAMEHIIGIPGLIKPAEVEADVEAWWPLVSETLSDALQALNEMRVQEGANLANDILARIALLESGVDQVAGLADGLVAQYQERLQGRITELTRGGVEIDPARIAQEAAFLADRSDISEEIVRAHSHVAQFRALADDPEPAGRKLNFLLQEMNRELNTMGVKVGSAAASHIIVNMKSELEKIREQIQNVE